MKRSRYIHLLASVAGLAACSDYQTPQSAIYNDYQSCVQEWGEEHCEEIIDVEVDLPRRYGASYYYAGGKVYAYNKAAGRYQLLPGHAGIYQNPGLVPVRSSEIRTGGFGQTARGTGVGG
ncbi:hypothetical protein DV704_07210 [Meiothermus sp. QL-1]|uniref:hypothetical protein n=1 Tax=Meiothermus sp. QL-1 TaxID=2058095 RepID=UPI000E0CBDE0|nr:hypothetical protein [Meiothermus sp. QL-1]RDI95353.1 hypothetical protein DV704_07210 [Meiothermus sp. QL-1]